MKLLEGVKEEHGERGLGLTHIYKVGMKSCLDFNHPEDALRLFDEASGEGGRGGGGRTRSLLALVI